MNKNWKIALFLVLAASVAECAVAQTISALEIRGDFEGIGTPGVFSYRSTQHGLDIDYYSPTRKSTMRYRVSPFDVCSSMAMYEIPHSKQVAIDGSCSSQGGQIFRNIYEWNASFARWCLIREVTGEKADITAGTLAPTEHVARVIDCPEIGRSGPYSYESAAAVTAEVENELRRFVDASRNKDNLKMLIASMPDYAISELSSYVGPATVESINNLAFYLTENGRSYEAIPILEEINSKFPDRVVAKLNLADAYWNSGFKTQAGEKYTAYLNQMKQAGKASRVPKRVFDWVHGVEQN